MDLTALRKLLRPIILGLKDMGSHKTLPDICRNLGLPELEADETGTKFTRVCSSFDKVADEDLPYVAAQFLKLHSPSASVRNEIQDALWADSSIEIPKRCRREIARALEKTEIYLDGKGFDELLDALWILDKDPLGWIYDGLDNSLQAQICQHVHRNPDDWSVEELFDRLGAFDASNRRFALFIEGLASCKVRPDEPAQRNFVKLVNPVIRGYGLELRESGTDGGYPTFLIASTRHSSMGRPKNLIFASAVKPDLRFRDAVNNDIEIVTNADKVLVYDRPIGAEGLRWSDLQLWWSETKGIANDKDVKETLYRRLLECLPTNSPPQRLLFYSFFRSFRNHFPKLPALLPEVWLHWDPKTVKERGADSLSRFRMDFLMLLPNGVRVVIEVDGAHHYSNPDGQADCSRYAEMVAADRDLKLYGYEVFRFGGAELQGDSAPRLVKSFFELLFKRFSINPL